MTTGGFLRIEYYPGDDYTCWLLISLIEKKYDITLSTAYRTELLK